MPESDTSREFSICLLADPNTTHELESIRHLLPASPYRDDPPHLTLLRGITIPAEMDDQTLIDKITSQLALNSSLPFVEMIQGVTNKGNEMYSLSGLLIIEPSTTLLQLRQEVITKIITLGFSIEPGELNSFLPHLTVRLGVPLEGEMLKSVQKKFLQRKVAFDQWLLFRVMLHDNKRLIREVHVH